MNALKLTKDYLSSKLAEDLASSTVITEDALLLLGAISDIPLLAFLTTQGVDRLLGLVDPGMGDDNGYKSPVALYRYGQEIVIETIMFIGDHEDFTLEELKEVVTKSFGVVMDGPTFPEGTKETLDTQYLDDPLVLVYLMIRLVGPQLISELSEEM